MAARSASHPYSRRDAGAAHAEEPSSLADEAYAILDALTTQYSPRESWYPSRRPERGTTPSKDSLECNWLRYLASEVLLPRSLLERGTPGLRRGRAAD